MASSISTFDLASRIADGSVPAIIDVRSGREFKRGHVPGALHVPFWMLPFRLSRLPSRDRAVVVYCGHGPRARIAGSVLRLAGFRSVVYLAGHMSGWRRAGLREER
jgi:rhodanese-related sulfurtransferase